MRIYKISIYSVVITLWALLYVHQQVQLVRISYDIESKEKQVSALLDQNKSLVYNITKQKSPVYLEKKLLASKKEFSIPQQWNVVEVSLPKAPKQPVVVAQVK